ncbi:hypothetical protein F3Y22_tig00110788pilonHSYRG00176 [Hibiscus syriacus]|uniref:Uncharacterized protein n=1 Tax=Hibiscus syriacus TaxID=106335 RepID=A0A6A2ZR61_HIBSY|nr:hypothetical protein F3Y22_tig00110788pilonHSYRG00176 [Hibiscus syriacus]
MEGSESEAIFDSLNLNPQLFINETLNTVDDLLNDAFDFYLQEASKLLKTDGSDRSHDLTKDELLARSSMIKDALSESDVDAELDSLRNKLTLERGILHYDICQYFRSGWGRDCSELKEFEIQSVSRGHFAGLINEALQIYEDTSVHDMFQGLSNAKSNDMQEFLAELKKM